MIPALLYAVTVACLLLLAGALHAFPRLGHAGRGIAAAAARAPGLDVIVLVFTVLPPIVGAIVGAILYDGPARVAGCFAIGVAAQLTAMLVWIAAHELAHRSATRGPRIVTTLNRTVGPLRNHLAVWWTALAVPLFGIVRLAEILLYPPLIWLVRFPRYRQGDWVNVSRQKFEGLVGYDRIWCLYCDWMTGVWSLGGEMLRNVESFWCPIRFASPEKCENCRHDFPDIDGGWVPADATMRDVAAVLDERYPGPGANAWYGHPTRLTIDGRDPGAKDDSPPPSADD